MELLRGSVLQPQLLTSKLQLMALGEGVVVAIGVPAVETVGVVTARVVAGVVGSALFGTTE